MNLILGPERPAGLSSGRCPGCGSHEIYRGISTEGEGLTAGSYTSLVEINAGNTQATLWIDTYICRGCGLLEMYVANREQLALLSQADGWERVEARPLTDHAQ